MINKINEVEFFCLMIKIMMYLILSDMYSDDDDDVSVNTEEVQENAFQAIEVCCVKRPEQKNRMIAIYYIVV